MMMTEMQYNAMHNQIWEKQTMGQYHHLVGGMGMQMAENENERKNDMQKRGN